MGLYAKHMFSFNQELIKTEAEKWLISFARYVSHVSVIIPLMRGPLYEKQIWQVWQQFLKHDLRAILDRM